MEDTEQLDELKNWWDEKGKRLVSLAAIAAALFLGWKYWQNKTESIAETASIYYEELQASINKKDHETASVQAKEIKDKFTKTPYASLASFHMAKAALVTKDYDTSKAEVEWVIKHTKDASFKQIALTQLAKIHLAKQEPDQALSILEGAKTGFMQPVIDELKGDAYMMQADRAKAYAAYVKASEALEEKEVNHFVLQMKLQQLADQKYQLGQ